MAARLIWSQEALDDVDAIAAYINRDSPYHARRVVQELFAMAESGKKTGTLPFICVVTKDESE